MKKYLLLSTGLLLTMAALFVDSTAAHQIINIKTNSNFSNARLRPCHPSGDIVPCGHALHYGGDLISCQHICNGLYGPVACHPVGDVTPCFHPSHLAGDLVPCDHFCY